MPVIDFPPIPYEAAEYWRMFGDRLLKVANPEFADVVVIHHGEVSYDRKSCANAGD